MSDYIWLIRSDSLGNPHPGGSIGHYVLVTQNPTPAVFNEFTDGGAYQHADCGEACILSALADRGQHPTAKAVEAACGATAGGTTVGGVSNGLGHFGVVNTWEQGNPVSGYIMNPAGGRIIPPSEFPAYLAATGGYIVSFAATGTPETPDMTPEQAAMLQAINDAIFEAAPPGVWNNFELLRRQNVDLGAPYGPASGVPPVPPTATPGSGLTAAQASELTAIAAALGRIETSLKGS
jgi:hypothetical protein